MSRVNPPPPAARQQWGSLGFPARESQGLRTGLASARCKLGLATSGPKRRRARARRGQQRRGTPAPAGTTRGLAPRWPRGAARAEGERGALLAPGRREGGARAAVSRAGSRGGGGAGRGRAGWGRGAARSGEGGAAARGRLRRPECHTRGGSGGGGSGSGRRRRDWNGQGRAPAASLRSLARSLSRPPAAGPGSPQRSREGRRGAEDADKFPQRPRIQTKAEAAAPTGQERVPRRSARPGRPGARRRAFRSPRGRGPGSHETPP
nr:translation initiation factor IF-2-like [Equus asinus]